MLFRKNRPVRIEFVLAGQSTVIGYDEIPAKRIPIDFDIPTFVEIDGSKYAVKATDPSTRAEADKAGSLKVWVEKEEAPQPEPKGGEDHEAVSAQVVSASENPVEHTFKAASCAAQAPRLSGKKGDYHFVELMPWQWRQVEFIRRDLAPEIGEEFGGVQAVVDEAVSIDGNTRFHDQHVRELTQLAFRGLEVGDIGVQGRFFTFAGRRDGVALMGQDGYVDNGFGYVLGSGIGVYGQEFDEKIRCMALVMGTAPHPAHLDEDIAALASMMAELQLVLVDWDRLTAVEANPMELREYLEGWFA